MEISCLVWAPTKLRFKLKQFRGGATMHGPKPRSHAFKLQKKVRRLGLKIALSARTAEGKVSAASLNQCVFLVFLVSI